MPLLRQLEANKVIINFDEWIQKYFVRFCIEIELIKAFQIIREQLITVHIRLTVWKCTSLYLKDEIMNFTSLYLKRQLKKPEYLTCVQKASHMGGIYAEMTCREPGWGRMRRSLIQVGSAVRKKLLKMMVVIK